MLEKTIKYKDYNGVERTETHHFNLSTAEVTKMETSTSGGFTQMIYKIIETRDIPSLVKIFDDIILKSYGEKSPDGRRFIKSEELSTAFSQTEAYTTLFMELISDSKKAAEFVNGVLPQHLEKTVQEMAGGTVQNGDMSVLMPAT